MRERDKERLEHPRPHTLPQKKNSTTTKKRRDDSDSVLLLQRRSRHHDRAWGLPGGNVEPSDLSLLDAAELRRITAVGPCLPCHEAAGDRVWKDFASSKDRLARAATGCRFRANR